MGVVQPWVLCSNHHQLQHLVKGGHGLVDGVIRAGHEALHGGQDCPSHVWLRVLLGEELVKLLKPVGKPAVVHAAKQWWAYR